MPRKARLWRGVATQVAREVDAARDGEEGGEQHDERDVVVQGVADLARGPRRRTSEAGRRRPARRTPRRRAPCCGCRSNQAGMASGMMAMLSSSPTKGSTMHGLSSSPRLSTTTSLRQTGLATPRTRAQGAGRALSTPPGRWRKLTTHSERTPTSGDHAMRGSTCEITASERHAGGQPELRPFPAHQAHVTMLALSRSVTPSRPRVDTPSSSGRIQTQCEEKLRAGSHVRPATAGLRRARAKEGASGGARVVVAKQLPRESVCGGSRTGAADRVQGDLDG